MCRGLIRHFGDGGTVTLRRRHTLKKQRRGEPVNALLVHGNQTAGASTLVLRADLLTGRLPKGCVVTVSGTGYTVQADAEAVTSGTSGVLTVTVLPVLAGNLSDGTAATVTTTYVDYSFTALRGRADVEDMETGERETRRTLHLAYRSDCTPAPDDLVVVDGTARGVAGVDTVDGGGGAVRYRLTLGAA